MDLIPQTFITKSPDITSIISAFEEKRNPLELFTSPNIKQEIEDQLNTIESKIDGFISFLTKFHSTLHPDDCKTYTKHLTIIQQKLNVNFEKSCNTICTQCEATFNLNDPKDLDELLNHVHAVELLAKKSRKYDIAIQQISKRNTFRCLACRVLITGRPKNVRSHVRSKLHRSKISNVAIYSVIEDFIEAFEMLPQPFRVFDVLFEPSDRRDGPSGVVFCTVCGAYVCISDLPQHVVKNETHVVKFLNNDYSFLNGYNEMLDLIGCAKSEVMNGPGKVKTKTEKPRKKMKKTHAVIPAYNSNMNGVKTVNDFIPNRLKNHVKYIAGDFKVPVCSLCTSNLKGAHDVVAHLISDEHRLKCRQENITINNYYYYCCLCCKHIKKEFAWMVHMNSVAHQEKESLMHKQGVQTIFTEYECSSCLLVWYGHPNTVFAHKRNNFGPNEARFKQKEVTLSNEMKKILKDETTFTADINKAVKESNDVLNSIESSYKCCQAIEAALATTFGEQIRAYPFGSRVSGLGNIASDLDVFVDIGSMYEGTINQNAQFQSYCVQQTATALRRHKDFTDICPIPQARTPIVQVFHKLTDLDCDLSFRHGLSIENTQFLKFCINIQPKLRSLILFLKKWIRLNKFRDRISTYGISLMSIYMMQNKGYLPSLAKLREIDPQQTKIIAGWETFHFNKPQSEIEILYPPYQKSERHLLTEFFDFYINFDFKNDVVCPLLGQPVQKNLFHADNVNELCLPKEMYNYVNKIKENENHERIKITKSICIQDPFDLSHNVTKALPIEVFYKMITLMKQSHQLLL